MTSPIILPAPSLISTASYVRPLNYMSIPSITKSGPIRYQTCYRQPKQQVELSRKVDVNQLNHVVWTSRILTTLYWHKKKHAHSRTQRQSRTTEHNRFTNKLSYRSVLREKREGCGRYDLHRWFPTPLRAHSIPQHSQSIHRVLHLKVNRNANTRERHQSTYFLRMCKMNINDRDMWIPPTSNLFFAGRK